MTDDVKETNLIHIHTRTRQPVPDVPNASEMSALIRTKDWSKTVLGSADSWPPSLKLVVNTMLASDFPMAVRWGPDFVMIYNDGYRPILGDKHPWALGLPFREAHHITGRIVAAAEKEGVALNRLPLAAMQAIEPRIGEDVRSALSVERSVKSRTSYGGTAPTNVRREARAWLRRLGAG